MINTNTVVDYILSVIRPKIDKINNKVKGRLLYKSKRQDKVDPYTLIDLKIEKEIKRLIKKKFPNQFICSEETNTKNLKSKYKWIIDPIDGTKSLILGLPTWSNLIGFFIEGQPKIGFANFPRLNKYYFTDGKQSFVVEKNKRKKILSGKKNFKNISLVLNSIHPFKKKFFFKQILNFKGLLKLSGADAYNYCLLAEGKIDVIIDVNLKPFDIFPLVPILHNSGAIITNFNGEKKIDTSEIIVSRNRILHKKMLRIFKKK